jgi:hypothetical protein
VAAVNPSAEMDTPFPNRIDPAAVGAGTNLVTCDQSEIPGDEVGVAEGACVGTDVVGENDGAEVVGVDDGLEVVGDTDGLCDGT